MFDNLFKEVMIFIDEILCDRDNHVQKEKETLFKRLEELKNEKTLVDNLYRKKIDKMTQDYEHQIFELKDKIKELRDEKRHLEHAN